MYNTWGRFLANRFASIPIPHGGSATSAEKLNNALTVHVGPSDNDLFDHGTTYTYDGSSAQTIEVTTDEVGAASKDHNHDGKYFKYLGECSDGSKNYEQTGYAVTTGDGGSKNFPSGTGKHYGALFSLHRFSNSDFNLILDTNGMWYRNIGADASNKDWVFIGGRIPNGKKTSAALGTYADTGSWIAYSTSGYYVQVNFWIKIKSTLTGTFARYQLGTGLPLPSTEQYSPAMVCDNKAIAYMDITGNGILNIDVRGESVAGTIINGGFMYESKNCVYDYR